MLPDEAHPPMMLLVKHMIARNLHRRADSASLGRHLLGWFFPPSGVRRARPILLVLAGLTLLGFVGLGRLSAVLAAPTVVYYRDFLQEYLLARAVVDGA